MEQVAKYDAELFALLLQFGTVCYGTFIGLASRLICDVVVAVKLGKCFGGRAYPEDPCN